MRCIKHGSALLAALLAIVLGGCAMIAPTTTTQTKPTTAVSKPVKIEPPVSAESRQLYDQALAALKAGQYAEAERGLLTVARREPELAGPHGNLGVLYARSNRPALAIESLQQAIKLNPGRAAYYNELGMVYRREGKFDEARGYYTKALDADTNYAYAHLNLGILYDLFLQDLEKAMQHYQRYRELVPTEAGTVAKWIADLQQRGRAADKARGGKNG